MCFNKISFSNSALLIGFLPAGVFSSTCECLMKAPQTSLFVAYLWPNSSNHNMQPLSTINLEALDSLKTAGIKDFKLGNFSRIHNHSVVCKSIGRNSESLSIRTLASAYCCCADGFLISTGAKMPKLNWCIQHMSVWRYGECLAIYEW